MADDSEPNFNANHPELQEGEVFLTNMLPDRVLDDQSDWEAIGWATKRVGLVAYDRKGNPLDDYIPVFIQRSESEEAVRL